jgi:hypothetical protein
MALNSESVIKIVDLLCEGPIQGLAVEGESVFLDETPLKTGKTNNFATDDVQYDFNLGGRTQGQLSQMGGRSSTVTDINTEIGENYSETLDTFGEVLSRSYGSGQIIRQVTDLEVDFVELLFTIPRLFSTAMEGLAQGQLFDGTIQVKVYVQSQGSAYNLVYDRTVTGVSTSNYQIKTPRINLTGIGPWNIKVEKINLKENHFEVKYTSFEDISQKTAISNKRGNQIAWTSLIESQRVRSSYPYCVTAGLSISTRQFPSLPTRAYEIKGRIVAVPANATVRADGSLNFNGAFDGTLKRAWTTCPVCCFYDMVTNSRYGAGDFVTESNMSWVDLYPLAQYANQRVATPEGTLEPRFACNTVIGDQADAFNVLQDLASVFRGMLFWQANTIQATADHGNLDGSDVAAVHLYTNSNVVEGAFNYSGSSLKTRSTSIRVRYNDPTNFYKPNYVVVEDATLISKYGYQVKEIIGIGCTSKYQAQRLGRWMLASEELDGEVVAFATGLQGAVILPGQVFAVADEMRQGTRLAGRIASATTTAITTDQTISLPAGSTDRVLTCTLRNGSVQSRTISGTSGKVINVSSAFSSAPQAESLWSISASTVTEQKFRCLSVADGGDGTYSITGVQHNDSIYSVADSGGDLEFDDITTFDERPPTPKDLKVTFRQVKISAGYRFTALASWDRGTSGYTNRYEVRYRIGKSSWRHDETTNTIYEVDNLKTGANFVFEVRAVGIAPINKKSKWVSKGKNVPAPVVEEDPTSEEAGAKPVVVPPPDIDNVTVQANGDNAILRWTFPVLGNDLLNYIVVIRHSRKTDGTGTWANSTKIRTVSATTSYVIVPLLEGEYLLKARDEKTKLYSVNANSAVIDLPNPIPRLDIEVVREDQDVPPYQGQYDGVFYSEEYDGLVLDGDQTIDAIGVDIDNLSSFDFVGNRLARGTYYFENVLDLGGKFSVVFERRLLSRGLYPAGAIDERTALLDRWSDFDGDIPDGTSAELYFRTSDQATTDEEMLLEDGDFLLLEDGSYIQMESDIDFGPWQPMESGRYTGRQFQFKCDLTSATTDQTPVIDELGYTIQFESRTESSGVIASGAGAKAVTFTNAFYETPNIGITAFDLDSGDYYRVTSRSRTGFTVTFYNSSNAAIDRDFQYQVVGYGSEQP